MSEMIEKVAASIQKGLLEHGIHSDQFDPISLARAAIGAMRDPGRQFIWDAVYPIKAYDAGGKVAEQMYQAVIDAALNPSQT